MAIPSSQTARSPEWLPEGKRAAVCFTIDDIHPGCSTDAYEAGGDLGRGALRHVEWLLMRHPDLRVTLFTTADWREISPLPTRRLLARIPIVRDRVFLSPVLPAGTMRLDRHPEFVRYVSNLPRTEVALHGLHHIHRGPRIPVEYQEQSIAECARMLHETMDIFRRANLPFAAGMSPPGWDLPAALAEAMAEVGLTFVASARDIRTAVTPDATTAMSGIRGASLLFPELIQGNRLVHMTSNFQATSPIDRALDIVAAGGLLAIKAHIVKSAFGHVHLDGLDDLYANYLDGIFGELRRRCGESLWWTSMGEVARRILPRTPAD